MSPILKFEYFFTTRKKKKHCPDLLNIFWVDPELFPRTKFKMLSVINEN